jgi:hypothetical protein
VGVTLETRPPGGRLAVGAAIFGLGLICPVFVPLVAATGIPPGWKAGLSALLVLGIPEVFTLAAVAVLGKPGFEYLRGRILARLRRLAPPARVGRTRYRIGLVLFVLPLLLGWLGPYVLPHVPVYTEHGLLVHVGGDALLLVSLFVLGGDFWDKLRALFIHGAVARFG